MGVTLRRRGKTWWLFCHHRGRRIQRSTRTSDPRIARKAKRRLEQALADGTDLFGRGEGVHVFDVYADDWLGRQSLRVRPGTLSGYRQAVTAARKALGFKRLNEITRIDARAFARSLSKNSRGERRDPKTLRNLVNVVHAIFADALDAELVSRNPFANQGRLIQSVAGRRARVEDGEDRKPLPYSRAEQERLLDAAARQDTAAREVFTHGLRADVLAILLALRAGLRRSEVLGLERGDLDLAGRRIHVRRRISRHEVGAPKSKTSRRVVPMTTRLESTIREHLARLDRLALREGGKPDEKDPIFPAVRPRKGGTGVGGEQDFVRRFRRYMKEIGIPDRYQPMHQLRHTFASELLSAGVPPYWVSRWLGHADTRITERVYAHWIPRPDEPQVVDLLETGEAFASLMGRLRATSRYKSATTRTGAVGAKPGSA